MKTGSWFTQLPEGHIRIGISRFVPRGTPAGYRLFKALAPGAWFKDATTREYLRLYDSEVLAKLDPALVVDQITTIAGDREPVLCCFEPPHKIAAGEQFCHRHIVAEWLGGRLGIEVPELNAPDGFDPWAQLKAEGVSPPSYR